MLTWRRRRRRCVRDEERDGARDARSLSARRVRKVIDAVEDEAPEGASAWRRILEQTTGALLRQSDEAEKAAER